jgi:hypothetical protein
MESATLASPLDSVTDAHVRACRRDSLDTALFHEGFNMENSFSAKFITWTLWICVAGAFAVAEIVTILAFRKMPNDHLFVGVGTKYLVAFIVALPTIAGVNGYYSVKRRLSSFGADVISVLERQFLFTIITAYMAIIFCVGPLAEVLQRFLCDNCPK